MIVIIEVSRKHQKERRRGLIMRLLEPSPLLQGAGLG